MTAARLFLLLVFVTASVQAATSASSLARLVNSPDDPVAAIAEGLHSPDALTRATAARLASVRGAGEAMATLREVVATEKDPDAAREEIRALILFGNDDDIDLAVKSASRFPPRMDGVVADAIARVGAPRALDLYPKYVKPLRRIDDESNFFRLALWQAKGDDASSLAAKLLEDGDDRGRRELRDGLGEADRFETRSGGVMKHSTPVDPAQLSISAFLPPGLSEAVVNDYGCRESLVGTANVTVDRGGRVKRFEARVPQTPTRCLDALANLVALSLFDPASTSSSSSDQIILVKPAKEAPCMDATPITTGVCDRAHWPGGSVTEPAILKQIEPDFPKDVVKSMTDKQEWDRYVIIQSTVDTTGCVRQMRIVRQSPYPALNAAAIEALSRFRFRPGTSDGVPAPVTFDVSVHFKL